MSKTVVVNGVRRAEAQVGEAHKYQYIGHVDLRDLVGQDNEAVLVPQWGEVDGGFQRPRKNSKVIKMGKYLKGNNPVHGTLILVVPKVEDISFTEYKGVKGIGTLSIKTEEAGSIWLTDGQHRWGGTQAYLDSLEEGEESRPVLVAVEVFAGLTPNEAAEMFQVTNTEADNISRSLLANVREMCPPGGSYGMTEDELMVAGFYRELGEEKQPFHGLVWDGKKAGRLGLDTFLRAMLNPRKPEESVIGSEGRYKKLPLEKRQKFLRGYFKAVGATLGENRDEMARAGFFRSLIAIYPDIMEQVARILKTAKDAGEKKGTPAALKEVFSPMEGFSSKDLPGRSQRIVEAKLRELLLSNAPTKLDFMAEEDEE